MTTITLSKEAHENHTDGLCSLAEEGSEVRVYNYRGDVVLEELAVGESFMEAWICPTCGPVYINFLTVSKIDEETGLPAFQIRSDWSQLE